MEAYESYWRDSYGKDHSTSILPERRKDPKRITNKSIRNWGRKILGEIIDFSVIFFIAKGEWSQPLTFDEMVKEL